MHNDWKKSRHSDIQSTCVEAAAAPLGVLVRDSKDPVPVLHIPASRVALSDLIHKIKTA